jgi:hypothetical protein
MGKDSLEHLDVDQRVISVWILGKQGLECRLDLAGLV